VYAKFRNFPLRINKALGIFRIGITTKRTRTTVVAIRDAFQRPKMTSTIAERKKQIVKIARDQAEFSRR